MSDLLIKSPEPPARWYDGLAQNQQQGVAHILATIVAVNGSAPRALQAKMVITKDSYCDTLGGGGLEHDVMSTARQLLNGEIEATILTQASDKKAIRRDAVYTKHYPLGAKLAQCCGGSVTVMFECFNIIAPLSLLVFGAGHVAAALMTILAELPCQVDWVDSRAERFAPYLLSGVSKAPPFNTTDETHQTPLYRLPAHIRPHITDDPIDCIRPFLSPSNGQVGQRFVLVMTHDHSLDFDLVRAAVDYNLVNNNEEYPMPYIGCISSATKAKRFKDRLIQRGYSEQVVDNLTMPIGLPVGGKEPMAVAVSIAAQILQQYHH